MTCNTESEEIRKLLEELLRSIKYTNNKLIKATKHRARQINRQFAKCDIITAALQAMSEKKGEWIVSRTDSAKKKYT